MPCAAVSLHQTSPSCSIPGLRRFPCFPALCFTSCTPAALQRLERLPCPKQNQNSTAHIIVFFQSFNHHFPALRPWTYHGFSAHNSGAIAGEVFSQTGLGSSPHSNPPLAGLPRQRNNLKSMCTDTHSSASLPSPSLLLFMLRSALPGSPNLC